jgi:hypothetical protein
VNPVCFKKISKLVLLSFKSLPLAPFRKEEALLCITRRLEKETREKDKEENRKEAGGKRRKGEQKRGEVEWKLYQTRNANRKPRGLFLHST